MPLKGLAEGIKGRIPEPLGNIGYLELSLAQHKPCGLHPFPTIIVAKAFPRGLLKYRREIAVAVVDDLGQLLKILKGIDMSINIAHKAVAEGLAILKIFRIFALRRGIKGPDGIDGYLPENRRKGL